MSTQFTGSAALLEYAEKAELRARIAKLEQHLRAWVAHGHASMCRRSVLDGAYATCDCGYDEARATLQDKDTEA